MVYNFYWPVSLLGLVLLIFAFTIAMDADGKWADRIGPWLAGLGVVLMQHFFWFALYHHLIGR